MSKEYIRKLMDISGKIADIQQADLPNSDYQGAIEAQIANAIRFGYELAQRGAA